jgi:hypothetical protein
LLKGEERLKGGVDSLRDGMLEGFPNDSVTEEVCAEESSGWRRGRRGVTGMAVGGNTEVSKDGFMIMEGSMGMREDDTTERREVLEVMLRDEDIVDNGGGVSGGGERVC